MSLTRQAGAGVRWTGLATFVTFLILFGQTSIVARLLNPADFGVMGMVGIILGFTQLFADTGLSSAIIQRRSVERHELSSLYWLNVATGVLLFAVLFVAAPFLAAFFSEPRLSAPVQFMAVTLVLNSWGAQFRALFQKGLEFDVLARRDIAGAAAAGITTVIAAHLRPDVWALVWGAITGSLVRTLLTVIPGWRRWPPSLRFRLDDTRGFMAFGGFQLGERSINFLSSNTDYLLIGRFLGAEALGVYTIAYQLVIVPLIKINPVLTRVAFPLFARVQDDLQTLRRGFVQLTKLLAFVSCPLLIGLAVTAPYAVPVFFGPGWEDAIPLVRILAILGILKAAGNPIGAVLLARGRADIGFYWNVFVAITNLVVFATVVEHGVLAVATAYASLAGIYFLIGYGMLRCLLEIDWRDYWAPLRAPGLYSIAMGGVVLLVSLVLPRIIAHPLAILCTLILVGGTVYSALYIAYQRAFITNLFASAFPRKEPVT